MKPKKPKDDQYWKEERGRTANGETVMLHCCSIGVFDCIVWPYDSHAKFPADVVERGRILRSSQSSGSLADAKAWCLDTLWRRSLRRGARTLRKPLRVYA